MSKPLDNRSPHYEEVKSVALADIAAGVLIVLGTTLNIFPMVDVSTGNNYAAVYKSAKVTAAKGSGAMAAGDAIYYDPLTDLVTLTSTSNILIGFVARAALSADTEVEITFDGTLAFAKA